MSKKPLVTCPTCGKKTVWSEENSYRPFCCERCKLIDLGAWANEEYQIPATDNSDLSSSEVDDFENDSSFSPTRH